MQRGPYEKRNAEERFWSKVDKSGECWLWTACKNSTGYGYFSYEGQMRRAHRVAYELTVGPIPEGLTLDHLCRVQHCVNPAHLEPVTQKENVLRGERFSAVNAKKTHCPQKHPLSGENLYVYPEGHRACRACRRGDRKRWKRKQRKKHLKLKKENTL